MPSAQALEVYLLRGVCCVLSCNIVVVVGGTTRRGAWPWFNGGAVLCVVVFVVVQTIVLWNVTT